MMTDGGGTAFFSDQRRAQSGKNGLFHGIRKKGGRNLASLVA